MGWKKGSSKSFKLEPIYDPKSDTLTTPRPANNEPSSA